MSSPQKQLAVYGQRIFELGSLYSHLKADCEKQVESLQELSPQVLGRNTDFKIEFAQTQERDHFRVVCTTGVLVVMYNDPHGHIGAYLNFFHSPELVNSTRAYTLEVTPEATTLVQIDSTGKKVCKKEEIVPLLLSELFIPTVMPERIKQLTEQQSNRDHNP